MRYHCAAYGNKACEIMRPKTEFLKIFRERSDGCGQICPCGVTGHENGVGISSEFRYMPLDPCKGERILEAGHQNRLGTPVECRVFLFTFLQEAATNVEKYISTCP